MTLRAGKMDRKITLQRASAATVNGFGEPQITWGTLLETWAQEIPIAGSEVYRSGREVGARVSRFFMRWFSDFTEKDRISYDGRIWDILSIREIDRKGGLEVLAQAQR